jgi:hypothetical protein
MPQKMTIQIITETMKTPPNQSPEPTRVGAVSNPRRFGLFIVAGRGWLSFFR